MSNNVSFTSYRDAMQKIADIRYSSAVLQWDQETYMPPAGADFRGRQIATLNEMAHERFTDSGIGELLSGLLTSTDLSESERRNAELSAEDFARSRKLPSTYVRKLSEAVNRSFHAWIHARKKNNFDLFEKPLQEIIDLKKEEADLLGYTDHPYDALMYEYDRGLTTAIVDKLFANLRPGISLLLNEISSRPHPDDTFLFQHFEKDKQWKAGLEILKVLRYDFNAGRQDISEHPFTTNFSSRDVRITTRVDEDNFSNMMWSCIHEAGHALYEQGLPADQYGMPLGEYCSLSIHESQSRLWENCIGRSLNFWQQHFHILQDVFPRQFSGVTPEIFYRAVNKVQPSLIRTEADELTYHFHVMIRYEIEKLLIGGSISAKDVPPYWNEHYQKYLGITVPDDLRGCLQDVHWSHGSFGYFATYSVGSLYAAQFANAAGSNDTAKVHEWLQKNIYPHGRKFNSEELCTQVTGQPLTGAYFLDYAGKKFREIYM